MTECTQLRRLGDDAATSGGEGGEASTTPRIDV